MKQSGNSNWTYPTPEHRMKAALQAWRMVLET